LAIPKSNKGLKDVYDGVDQDVRYYLNKLEPLLDNGNNYEIAVSYCLTKLEEGHYRSLKCGLVRIHECDSKTVDTELDKHHFTAETYAMAFKNVFSSSIPTQATVHLAKAQEIRNRIIHGKNTTNPKRREAIYHVIEYMRIIGALVEEKTATNPYGDLRGLKGRKTLLSSKSSIQILKGLGLWERRDRLTALR